MDARWDSRARNAGVVRSSERSAPGSEILGVGPGRLRQQSELLRRARLLEARGSAIAAVVTYGEVIRTGRGGIADLARQRLRDIVRGSTVW